jgi:hypothetical protein
VAYLQKRWILIFALGSKETNSLHGTESFLRRTGRSMWSRFFLEFFGFSPVNIIKPSSPLSYVVWGMNKRPVRGRR